MNNNYQSKPQFNNKNKIYSLYLLQTIIIILIIIDKMNFKV